MYAWTQVVENLTKYSNVETILNYFAFHSFECDESYSRNVSYALRSKCSYCQWVDSSAD